MLQIIDERFEQVKKTLQLNNNTINLAIKAYNLAKFLHRDQRRKDGSFYISHPVEVALILAQLGFDENVVSAAILHDVVEDCEYKLEDIKTEFNNGVAEMVDCVSAIDETKYVFDKNDIYEDVNFEKASLEEQSFKKLIEIGKKNPLGFCIKFADRLHNLRTISCFNYNVNVDSFTLESGNVFKS